MLDKLKRLFVITEEGGAASKSADKIEDVEVKEDASAVKTQKIEVDTTNIQGAPDQKYIDILLNAIDKNNIEGYDYLEYKQALQSLDSMAMDEATKFKSALAMAGTLGGSKDKIVNSADQYLSILAAEQNKFNTALESQRQRVAQSEKNGISAVEQSITNKQKQVESLLAEIEKEKIKLSEMTEEVKASATKIEQTAANFVSAYNLVVNQIKEDISKIKQYIN